MSGWHIVLLLLSGGFVGFGFWMLWIARRSRSWPTVPGTMLHSGTEYVQDPDRLSSHWRPSVHYEYIVQGVRYVGTDLHADEDLMLLSRDAVRDIVASYPVGSTVNVYYDPHRPGRSVLRPGGGCLAFLAILLGVSMLSAWILLGSSLEP